MIIKIRNHFSCRKPKAEQNDMERDTKNLAAVLGRDAERISAIQKCFGRSGCKGVRTFLQTWINALYG
ncbi:hypothetical protein RHMOL_Rhmol01G0372500 [Rhododendron molle]|uniref:Uncharacterized protein n=1 Tax=Rhododendron molle TaxID=49168 RepID=A0ACC0QB34_RHOML|nr:hypothetical protein RHMOL_Rhmol01G0372500 [Rhododendron molle]